MTTLADVLRTTTALAEGEIEWLQLIVGDWQLVADLSFSDLVLWVEGVETGWLAVGHVRPNTGPMVFYDDIVGRAASSGRAQVLGAARTGRASVAQGNLRSLGDLAIREEAVPIVRRGKVVGVLTRHTNLTAGRTPSRLELTYKQLADALMGMISRGEFPFPSAPTGQRRGAPRVGDGVIHLGADGTVRFASPNAISAFHRLGHHHDLGGQSLAKVVTDLVASRGDSVDESLAVVVTGKAPWRSEVGTAGATVSLRAIPLTQGTVRVGAMLLIRDVSELRRGEQELLTKEATIREIHHRVKNNLQTVAALLRLQARRIPDPTARGALDEAVRRVGTIALVHETLSQGIDETVNFDEIALSGLRAVVEVARREHHVDSSLTGSFGRLRAEDATSLAMIMSELIQNAVEHGLVDRPGRVDVVVEREPGEDGEDVLSVAITDDGAGLPTGFRPGLAGLGTRIVTSLVQDLRGRIRWANASSHGTRVEFHATLRPLTR